jgi:hypothetical protein
MEFVGLLVDFAVPAVAAIGSGLVAYALTGGEEEVCLQSIPGEDSTIDNFNSLELVATEESGSGLTNNSFDEEIKDNDDEIARSFIQQGAEIRMETSLSNIDGELRSLQNLSSTIVGKVDLLSQVQPIWATMMLEKLNELSNTVRELQMRVDMKEDGTSNISSVERLKEIIDDAMFAFYHGIGDDVTTLPVREEWISDPKYSHHVELSPTIGPACDMLLMFIKNIQRNPDTLRFRKIPTNNSNYRTLLAAAPGHKRILRSIGFVLKGNNWEWDWISEAHSPPPTSSSSQLENVIPTTKDDALALLTYAADRLQQIRANRFDLVSVSSSTTNLNTPSTINTCAEEAAAVAVISAATPSAATIPTEEHTKSLPETSTTPILSISVPVSSVPPANNTLISPSESSTADNNNSQETENPSTPPRRHPSFSSTSSAASSYSSMTAMSTSQCPLSPEVQAVLTKAKSISAFSTSRGALGISPMATTATAANLFAHDEV